MGLLVALLVSIAVFVAGCKAAAKAGAGSRNALVLWIVIALVEAYLTVSALFSSGRLVALLGVTALAVQGVMYFNGRKDRPSR